MCRLLLNARQWHSDCLLGYVKNKVADAQLTFLCPDIADDVAVRAPPLAILPPAPLPSSTCRGVELGVAARAKSRARACALA